jgi:hypothetical protein
MILICCAHAYLFVFLSYDIEMNYLRLGNQGHTLFLPLEEAHPILGLVVMQ